MKKYISLILIIAIIVSTISGCSNMGAQQSKYSDEVIVEEIIIDNTSLATSDVSTTSDTETSNQTIAPSQEEFSSDMSSTVDPADCSHSYDNVEIEQTAELFKAGIKKYTCTKCGDSYSGEYPLEKIKLLSISNSYGKNALWELYNICKLEGIKEIDIAVMYIAGCSLDQHWENIQGKNATYEVFRNNNGNWTSTLNCSIDDLLDEGDWDVITTQNSSGMSGKSDGFTNFDNVTGYIADKCPNAKLVWHMIWGYQSGSKWLTPTNYEGDEMLMYNSIVKCTKDIVVSSGKYDSIVPVGAAIMNARTSNLKGDIHLDDGSHLSEKLGYHIAAYTWYCHLTGQGVYDTKYAASNMLSTNEMNIVLESVKNAIKNPYEITQSYYTN